MSKIPLTCSKVRETSSSTSTSDRGSSSSSVITHRRNPKAMVTPPNLETRGEKFYEFMKSIGYKPSSKLRPEHLESYFHDERTATAELLRRVMKKVKKENGLDPEEVQKFQKLKVDEIALYGKDLEEAVDRKNALERRVSEQLEKKSAEMERLRQLLAQRKAEVSEIKSRTDVIGAMVKATQDSKVKGQAVAARIQRESKDLDVAIQVNQKRLNDRTDAIKKVKSSFLADDNALSTHMKNAQNLVAIVWEEILESEDDLANSVTPLIQNHVAELIIRAEGYEDHKNDDEDLIRRQILVKHSVNLERLKHCIIYERVRQTKLEIQLAGEKGAFVMMSPCLEQIRRVWMSSKDEVVIARFQQEIDDSINLLEGIYEKEYERAVGGVRGEIHGEMNSRLETLSNIKALAKKRLYCFFDRVCQALVPQKIRVDILRNVLKAEVNHYDALVQRIQKHNDRVYFLDMESSLLLGNLDHKNLTTNGLAIQAFLNQHEIPSSVLCSVPGTWDALSKIHRIGQTKCSLVNSENVGQCLKDQSLEYQKLVTFYTTLKDKYLSSNSKERQRLQALENIHQEMEINLKSMQENKSAMIEDNIAEKQYILKKMKKALAHHSPN